jgi:hypothetical protein
LGSWELEAEGNHKGLVTGSGDAVVMLDLGRAEGSAVDGRPGFAVGLAHTSIENAPAGFRPASLGACIYWLLPLEPAEVAGSPKRITLIGGVSVVVWLLRDWLSMLDSGANLTPFAMQIPPISTRRCAWPNALHWSAAHGGSC